MNAERVWTDERVEALRQAAAEGLTATQIARRLGEGVTRGMVFGKAFRLEVKLRSGQIAKERTGFRKHQAHPSRPACTLTVLSSNAKRLVQLGARDCKFPINDPEPHDQFLFCANPRREGFPYCAGHTAIAFRVGAQSEAVESQAR